MKEGPELGAVYDPEMGKMRNWDCCVTTSEEQAEIIYLTNCLQDLH